MALCDFKRMGNDAAVWVNPSFVVAVHATENLGTQIAMHLNKRDGTPMIIQVDD